VCILLVIYTLTACTPYDILIHTVLYLYRYCRAVCAEMAEGASSNGTSSIDSSAPQSLHKGTLSAVAEGSQGDAASSQQVISPHGNILGNAATNTSLNKKLHGYVCLFIIYYC
jgi:hypothetical protein